MPKQFEFLLHSPNINFGQIITLITHEYPNQEANAIIRDFCLTTMNPEFQKKGLEFLYVNGLYEDLQLLVNINIESDNPNNQNWGKVYQLILDRRTNKQSPAALIKQFTQLKNGEPELLCVIKLSKLALYQDVKDFGNIGNFLDIQPELFDQVEDRYLLSCFQFRLHQQLFIYYWMRNELIIARKYAFRALTETNNELTKANINTNLGLTYTFDTYHQGMYHLNEAKRLFLKNNAFEYSKMIDNNNIPFLSAHFGQVDGIETNDKSEQAHIEIAKGNHEKAIKILETLPMESPFNLYYLGVAKQDKNILVRSYNYFIEKRSDYFFSRLPLNALRKLDY
ncbi:AimR family lysis-lysogeny pheromone receptor [Paracerasibacillus soli]|uniref:AimR family lysis-lysogeny pheromone receptor n=2 Tax=Paracerasibacillus soli TaxID=480284 RepID=A0ABU5CSZ6_9BACI|nr:AimR family lysis-lysogeny pheromone receptor [Virgibacillus soli]MDY0409472.1 AimR family lysis-lysogeny pheromone receptor [Virgibacillus soli]